MKSLRAVGGVLALIGLAITGIRCASSKLPDAGTVDLEGLRAIKTGPRHITVTGVKVEWDSRRYRPRTSSDIFTADPRVVTPVADARELIARRKELVGSYVRMETPPSPAHFFFLSKRSRDDGRSLQQDTALYVPLEGMAGAAWIVSEVMASKEDPKAKTFLDRTSHVGVARYAVDVSDGSLLAIAFEKSNGRRLPDGAVALETAAPLPADTPMEVWAPIELPGRREIWIAMEGTPPLPPDAVTGVLDIVGDRALDTEIGRLAGTGPDFGGRRVIWIGDSYRALHPETGRVSYVGLGALGIGLLVLALDVLLRRLAGR